MWFITINTVVRRISFVWLVYGALLLLLLLLLVKQGTDTALQWERNRKKTVLEYLPKLVLVGLIWVVTILVYM